MIVLKNKNYQVHFLTISIHHHQRCRVGMHCSNSWTNNSWHRLNRKHCKIISISLAEGESYPSIFVVSSCNIKFDRFQVCRENRLILLISKFETVDNNYYYFTEYLHTCNSATIQRYNISNGLKFTLIALLLYSRTSNIVSMKAN